MKLFVANLNFRILETHLRDVFSAYGDVDHLNIVRDASSGRSRGYGFVEMVDEEGAERAVRALHGRTLEGRELVVSIADSERGDSAHREVEPRRPLRQLVEDVASFLGTIERSQHERAERAGRLRAEILDHLAYAKKR